MIDSKRQVALLAAAAAAALLPGCGGMPQTAEEFRKAAPGAMLAKTDTYEVDRSFRDVSATFERKAPECLNMAVRTVSQTSTSYQNILTEYKATVVPGGQRAEMHLQQLHKGGGVIYPSKPPEGGAYIIVADAYPLPGNRTRMQLYGPSIGYDVVYRAIRGWAAGDNLGCPDLTKIGK
jgi:hypothetical protein